MERKRTYQHSFILITMLCIALLVGVSAATKVLATQSETYEKLKIFSEVLYLIQTNYIEEVDIQEVIYGGIQGMIKTLDAHSSFMPPDVYREMKVDTRGNFGGLGIQIAIRDDQLTVIAPIDDTPAFRAGVKAGDKIVKIEGETTKDMTLMEAVKLMRGPKGTSVTISIMRESFDKPKEFTITRDIIELKSVSQRMLGEQIGYVRLRQFQENTSTELEDALRELEESNVRALVMDLRSNPGGLLNTAVEVADKFLDKGKLIVYTEGRRKNQDMRFVAHQDFTHPHYPMAVLVNHGSASASEIVAGALQAHSRAVVIGTQSYGKGSVQSVIPLSDESGLRLTTAAYYTPDGRSIHEKGITPDIIVELEEFDPAADVKEDEQDADVLEKEQEDEEFTDDPVDEGEQQNDELEEILARDKQLERAVDVLQGILIFEEQSI